MSRRFGCRWGHAKTSGLEVFVVGDVSRVPHELEPNGTAAFIAGRGRFARDAGDLMHLGVIGFMQHRVDARLLYLVPRLERAGHRPTLAVSLFIADASSDAGASMIASLGSGTASSPRSASVDS